MGCEGEISVKDALATFKSSVWQHVGFPVEVKKRQKSDKTTHNRYVNIVRKQFHRLQLPPALRKDTEQP